MAELRVIFILTTLATELGIDNLHAVGDSMLAIKWASSLQVNKQEAMEFRGLLTVVMDVQKKFLGIYFMHTIHENNYEVDCLPKRSVYALFGKLKTLC